MKQRPPISKGELTVLKTIWELGEAKLGEAYSAFPDKSRLDYTSFQTYLRHLEAKGYLRTRFHGREKVYSPKLKPNTLIREHVVDLIDNLFDGSRLTRGISDSREVRQGT